MRLPRLTTRRLMVLVAVAGVILLPIVACVRWLYSINAWISINGLTIRF
jgi:hypothetical protein